MKPKNPPKENIHAVILAGGQGTRFWPLSRRDRPKQFLTILGRESLLQQTVKRLDGLILRRNILIVTYEKQVWAVRKQLPQLERRQILAEPAQRNTAAAIALAAHELIRTNPKAIMVVLPSDHLIGKVRAFHQAIRTACRVAATEGNSVLLGIPPSQPETGFGYLKLSPSGTSPYGKDVRVVERFTEKPDLKTAKRFLASGRYAWNAGMFVWRASTFLKNLARFLPSTANALDRIDGRWGKPAGRNLLARIYPRLKKISVDYGVMEKAPRVYAIPRDLGWSDVGSWAAVYETRPKDRRGNALPASHLSLDSRGNYISLAIEGKFVATIGIEDLIVVDTPDALLICRRDRSQEVGRIVEQLKKKRRNELF